MLCWVASQSGGFYPLAGSDPEVTIAAVVIARYATTCPYFLFKCDANWEVHQDRDCESVEQAQQLAAMQIGRPLDWRVRDQTR